MNFSLSMKHKVAILASATFIVMMILSVVFYKERTCFLDISFHLFYILKDNSLAIQANRFVAFFTQLFPLYGGRLGLPLSTIAIIYSMSFVILPFLAFLVIHLRLKNKKIAIAYLLFNTIMLTHTFYWIQSELPQTLAFFFILLALMDNAILSERLPSLFFWIPVSALSATIVFGHPLIIFAIAFAFLYYFFHYPKKRKLIYAFGLIIAAFFIIKIVFFRSAYDTDAMGGIKNFITLFPDYFSIESTKNYMKYFVQDYYFVSILWIASLIYYFRKRDLKKAGLLFIFFVAFSLLVNVTYYQGSDQFYLENQYTILAFFVALSFSLDILPKIKSKHTQFSILAIICAVCIFRIVHTHTLYTNRLNWNRTFLSKTDTLPNKKLIVPVSQVPIDTLLMTWGSAYELWLLSTIETAESRSIIIDEMPDRFDWALPADQRFITRWGVFDYSELNKKYFIFNDDNGYTKLP